MINDMIYYIFMNAMTEAFEREHHRGDESHLLREIVRTHQVIMAGFSRQVGMSSSRFALLRLLSATGGAHGVMDLARELGINASAVTRQVKEMEGQGLVERFQDARDGRRRYVKLSPEGVRLFEEIHDRSHDLERALSAIIDDGEMSVAVGVLTKLRGFIESLR